MQLPISVKLHTYAYYIMYVGGRKMISYNLCKIMNLYDKRLRYQNYLSLSTISLVRKSVFHYMFIIIKSNKSLFFSESETRLLTLNSI